AGALAGAPAVSTEAVGGLPALRPRGDAAGMAWGLGGPAAAERLTLARLLMARHDFRGALRVADTFDHPQPAMDLIFLPASLVIRVQAAEHVRDSRLEKRYREQLSLLGRSDLLTSLP